MINTSHIILFLKNIETNRWHKEKKVLGLQEFFFEPYGGNSSLTAENTAVIGMTRIWLAKYFVLNNVYSKSFFYFENCLKRNSL